MIKPLTKHCFYAAFMVMMVAAWLACPAGAVPTMLNSIPTPDIQTEKTFLLELNQYRYTFDDTEVPTESSLIYGLKYGFRNVEIGFDIVGDKDFEHAGLYATSGHLKWRILDQTTSSSPVSLAIGSMVLGGEKLPGIETLAYKPSPYIVVGHSFGDWSLTLGYQKSLYGFTRVDADPETGESTRRNDGILVGFSGTIIKSEKTPVTLMVDYFGGPMSTWGIGAYGPINDRFSWSFSYFLPRHDTLPDSGAEQPSQYWGGISYFIPLGE